MRVFITGGTGFIGSRLALRCLERGDSVKVLGQDNNQAEAENKNLLEARGAQVVLASVVDKERMVRELQGVDHVYHLAAAQHEANVPDQRFWDVNVTGTTNVLEASVLTGVKRFIHGSTIGVYGESLAGTIVERSTLKPNNIYGVTKLEGEKVVLSYLEKLPVVIVRISETYGPGDRRLLKLFKAIKKRRFFVIGKGDNLHHLTYIEDLIQGLFLAAVSESALGKAFVLAGKDYPSTNEMVEIIGRQFDTEIPRMHLPLFPILMVAIIMEGILRPLGIQPPLHRRRMDFFRKSFLFSLDQSRQALGYMPKVDFKEGVKETVQWYEKSGYL